MILFIGLLSLLGFGLPALTLVLSIDEVGGNSIAVISQYFAMVGLTGMGICALLASRWTILERVAQGLDKRYWLHKWVGIGTLLTLFLHDTLDAEIKGMAETWLSELGESFGELSYNILICLIIITLILFIPYRIWKFTHKFLFLVYVLGFLHALLMPTIFSLSSPAGLYIQLWGGFSILLYIYLLLLPESKRLPYHYRIHGLERFNSMFSVILQPEGESLSHKAGQFAFVKFDHHNIKEEHPFTISCSPQKEGTIRFSIKLLGDGTRQISENIYEGMEVFISQAHGRFGWGIDQRPQLWIAAGIGITPFLAMLASNRDSIHRRTLIHLVRHREDAPHWDEVHKLALNNPKLTTTLWTSSELGRFSPDRIPEIVKDFPSDYDIRYCGPEGLRKEIQEKLPSLGLSESHFFFEHFKIRSDIGITEQISKIIKWIVTRFPIVKKLSPWLINRFLSSLR
jgi:predicted ferric reductase